MTKEEILSLETPILSERCETLICTVLLVQKNCFNDERMVEYKEIPAETLRGRPLHFFNPFFGCKTDVDVKIAVAVCDGKRLTVIVEENGIRRVESSEFGYNIVESKPEETTMLSAQGRMHCRYH